MNPLIPFPTLTVADLEALQTPQAVPGGATEAVRYAWYSTQTYVSGSTTELEFFGQTSADPTITNMQLPNAMPGGTFFFPLELFFHVLQPVTAAVAAAAGAWNNVNQLLRTSRATLTFQYNNKTYLQKPLSLIPSPGGLSGFGYAGAIDAAAAATVDKEWASGLQSIQGAPWGGLCLKGQEPFTCRVRWSGAQTLTGNVEVQTIMRGVWYRRIV